MKLVIFYLMSTMAVVLSGDFYIGMFKRNDYLVAEDTLYRKASPYSRTYAKYGRIFNCSITYFRIVNRLGMGRPTVQIVRGGLGKRYIVARIRSPYNYPISVNIYVGCENKPTTKTNDVTTPVTVTNATTTDVTTTNVTITDVTANNVTTTDVTATNVTTTDVTATNVTTTDVTTTDVNATTITTTTR